MCVFVCVCLCVPCGVLKRMDAFYLTSMWMQLYGEIYSTLVVRVARVYVCGVFGGSTISHT